MRTVDFLKPEDRVTVTIYSDDNTRLYQTAKTGYHSLESAIEDAIANADLEINPEDCVFEVTNQQTDVSHRYRLNAHGNLKLIV